MLGKHHVQQNNVILVLICLLKSLVSVILVVSSNKIAHLLGEEGLY